MADSMIAKLFAVNMYPNSGASRTSTTTSTDKVEEHDSSLLATSTGSHTTPHAWNHTKYYIIAGVMAGVFLLALAVIAFFLTRRYRRRRAYAKVGLKQKDTDEKDVFSAEVHESDALHPHGAVIKERNFENGYDNVETQYDGRDYDPEASHGDKRAQL